MFKGYRIIIFVLMFFELFFQKYASEPVKIATLLLIGMIAIADAILQLAYEIREKGEKDEKKEKC